MYADILRYYDGKFPLIVAMLSATVCHKLIFTSDDCCSDAAWRDPVTVTTDYGYDPDIFWDDDGTVYVMLANNPVMSTFSVELTAEAIGPVNTKDNYCYLMISERRTEKNH
ncbi:hypothetical protein BJ878DRAFT_540341 [Calycina marina]|uniref:Uncharacterized protein n=1 Tax=Calycina marina TaxID=1763456 RepID=A0A9P7Z6P6_9HELO|nr:hypothetical protein BJ878DRAFT_540341 [Calycina marina]